MLALCLIGTLLSAALVRFSPGFGVDERELDPRLSQSSVESIRQEHLRQSSLLRYYGSYLSKAMRGDLGISESLQQPIAELIEERFPVTARSVLFGLITAWPIALLLAVLGVFFSGWLFEASSALFSGFLLSLPTAVIALLFVYVRAPVFLVIAVVTFPKLFRFSHNLFAQACGEPHVLAARARGIGKLRIVALHVIPRVAPALLALLGLSVSMSFGAAIPIETLCDSPGVGQLAWYAAINRDLPLLTNLTLIVTLVTVASNSLADSWSKLAVRQA